jgi:two-component system chemotaxis response regulator CheV
VAGTLLFRNRSIPLLDLSAVLGVESAWSTLGECPDIEVSRSGSSTGQKRVVLVTEFNGLTSAMLVDGVDRIHRVSWDAIKPLSSAIADCATEFTGSVDIDGHEVLVLDMEKIIADVLPGARIADLSAARSQSVRHADRAQVGIVLAEDSKMIRERIAKVLTAGGYTNLKSFENGRQAFDAIKELKTRAEQEGADVSRYISLVITDIEMPQINGLTLCRSLKQGLGMEHVPVLMFSSLTSETMKDECRAVGADGCITKPDIDRLVERIDALCLAAEGDARAA